MITIYGDESAEGKEQKLFVLAILIAEKSVWEAVESEWKERINGISFHATDCETGKGIYRKMRPTERQQLSKDLASIIARHPIKGWGVGTHRLQAADLLAYEFNRDLMRLAFSSNKPAREQLKILGSTGRFELKFLDSGYFSDFLGKYAEVAGSVSMGRDDFAQWAKSKNRQPNGTAMIEYAIEAGKEARNGEATAIDFAPCYMLLRKVPCGEFWGCAQFPGCKGSKKFTPKESRRCSLKAFSEAPSLNPAQFDDELPFPELKG